MNPIPPPPTSPHETRATGFLRPAVFGGSDGLVSNLALVMGVAGASSDNQAIVIAGIAGLLAGAFSMAVGEYISVRSQHELFDAQRRLQVNAAAGSTRPASAPSWRASTGSAASARRRRGPSWARSSRRRNARSTR